MFDKFFVTLQMQCARIRAYCKRASSTELSDTENLDNFQNHTDSEQWCSRECLYNSPKTVVYNKA